MIKTIILILLTSCFTLNANAVSTKEIIKKTPVLLLSTALQMPNAVAKAVSNGLSNNANVTLAEVYQHVLNIEQKVNAPSDYKIDQMLNIGIATIGLLATGGLVLILCICDKCKTK